MSQRYEAYWISPGGHVVPVESLHINTVLANLEKFGMDKKTAEDFYAKHKEDMGTEGHAREEILTTIIKKGWIRLRYNSKKMGWTAQLSKLDKRKKDYLWSFIDSMLEGKHGQKVSKYTELLALDLSGTTLYRGNFGDVHQKFFEEGIQYSTKYVMIEDMKPDTYLTEKTLSRVWQHVNSKRPLAIMTAFRNENTSDENKKRNLELSNLVRQAGWGYFWVDGYWVENQGHADETKVVERSLFIIADMNDGKKLIENIQKWIKKYNQDAAVIKVEGEDKVSLLFKDGTITPIGKWSPGKVAQAYSKLKNGRTFVFETAWEEPGVMGKWAKYYSQKSKTVLEDLDNRLKKSYNEV